MALLEQGQRKEAQDKETLVDKLRGHLAGEPKKQFLTKNGKVTIKNWYAKNPHKHAAFTNAYTEEHKALYISLEDESGRIEEIDIQRDRIHVTVRQPRGIQLALASHLPINAVSEMKDTIYAEVGNKWTGKDYDQVVEGILGVLKDAVEITDSASPQRV